MAGTTWSTEAHTDNPQVTFTLDEFFGGSLNDITGVLACQPKGMQVVVTFFAPGNVDLAMREIVQRLVASGHIKGYFRDDRTGVQHP